MPVAGERTPRHISGRRVPRCHRSGISPAPVVQLLPRPKQTIKTTFIPHQNQSFDMWGNYLGQFMLNKRYSKINIDTLLQMTGFAIIPSLKLFTCTIFDPVCVDGRGGIKPKSPKHHW